MFFHEALHRGKQQVQLEIGRQTLILRFIKL